MFNSNYILKFNEIALKTLECLDIYHFSEATKILQPLNHIVVNTPTILGDTFLMHQLELRLIFMIIYSYNIGTCVFTRPSIRSKISSKSRPVMVRP